MIGYTKGVKAVASKPPGWAVQRVTNENAVWD